jgi:hypothetical protein
LLRWWDIHIEDREVNPAHLAPHGRGKIKR